MKKVLNKIVEIILNTCILLALVALVFVGIYSFQIHVLKYDYADFFGYSAFEVATGSMAGSVEVGDVVIVEITKEILENDVIVYKEGDNFITHRVISINGDTIVTKGDVNNTEDEPIKFDNVVGKVSTVLIGVGTWKEITSTPSVYVPVMIGILLLGLAFSYTTEEDDEEDEKTDNKAKKIASKVNNAKAQNTIVKKEENKEKKIEIKEKLPEKKPQKKKGFKIKIKILSDDEIEKQKQKKLSDKKNSEDTKECEEEGNKKTNQ